MPALNLVVYLPECAAKLPRNQKVPLLVWVDQPGVDVRVSHQDITHQSQFDRSYGVFTHLIWLEGLGAAGHRILRVQAQKGSYDPRDVPCEIWRNPVEGVKGLPPHINYPFPNGNVYSNFAASGTVDLTAAPCTGWLADGSGKTYPGMYFSNSPGNWNFAFQNIPVGSYTLYVRDANGEQVSEGINVLAGP